MSSRKRKQQNPLTADETAQSAGHSVDEVSVPAAAGADLPSGGELQDSAGPLSEPTPPASTDAPESALSEPVFPEPEEQAPPEPVGTPSSADPPEDFPVAIAFAIPFAAVAATTMKNSAALVLVLAICMIPSAILYFLFAEKIKLPKYISVPLTAMVSMLLASLASSMIVSYAPTFIDSLGKYVYLLAAFPVTASAAYGRGKASLGCTALSALRMTVVFGILIMLTGTIREFFAYNTLWGQSLGITVPWLKLAVMRMPFAGFIVFGLVLALARVLYSVFRRSAAALLAAEKEEE